MKAKSRAQNQVAEEADDVMLRFQVGDLFPHPHVCRHGGRGRPRS